MSIAIVIPAYNAEAFIDRTIASVRAQTYADWRAYIVDDGSHDTTVEVARRAFGDDGRFVLVSQPNAGMPGARNTGRALALQDSACSSLMFLDNDDLLLPHALAVLSERLAVAPSAVAAYGIAKYIDILDNDIRENSLEEWCRARREPKGRFGVRTLELHEPTTFSSLVCVHGLPTPGTSLIRRSIAELIGPFDEELRLTSDWELFVRAARHGSIEFVDEVLLGFRLHDTNASKGGRIVEDTNLAWRKILKSELNSPAQRRQVRSGYRALQLSLARDKLRHVRALVPAARLGPAAREVGYAVKHLARAVRGPS